MKSIFLPHFSAPPFCHRESLSCNFAEKELVKGMFPYVSSAQDNQWQPGPYPGVELLTLHKNEQTGGLTVLRKFRAGTTVPAHIHPKANEFVYVLSGEWEESGVRHTTGAFFFAPRGLPHGPHLARSEVISLTIFDGPLTVVNAEAGTRVANPITVPNNP